MPGELQQLSAETGTQDKAVEVLAERAEALQNYVSRLTADVKDQLSTAIGDAEAGAERLIRSTDNPARAGLDARGRCRIKRPYRDLRRRDCGAAGSVCGAARYLDEGVGDAGERLALAHAITGPE